MTTSTAANRYARALLDVAVKEKADVDQIERELAFFVDLFANHAALAQVFLNPVVPAPRKRAAMDALTARAGVLPILGKLLGLLAERDRLVLMTSLLAAYRDRLLDHRNVVRAEVTTVAPLTPEHAVWKLEHLAGHRALHAVDTRNAVAERNDAAHLGHVDIDGVAADLLANNL